MLDVLLAVMRLVVMTWIIYTIVLWVRSKYYEFDESWSWDETDPRKWGGIK